MIRTQVYLTDDLYQEVRFAAKRENKKPAQVIREALKKGLKKKVGRNAGGTFLEIAAMAKKYNWRGPKDLSINHDKYLYEEG
ncbi:hypothetical protein HYT59_01280 [Candidatus Woesebacteria bacterium]|nr:hypothetical protein [Candidatus Woesebacteria bacterium]